MTQERWEQVKSVLDGALERYGTDRLAFLEASCRGDQELRGEVDSLLAAEAEAEDFIETPVFRIWRDGDRPLAEGQRLGAYRILRESGKGGMGSIYLAERADQTFDRQVAIKLVRRGMDTDEIVRRFRAERQILAHLTHPNIAGLLDAGTTEDGRPYFVMEWIDGQPIDAYCNSHELSTKERLALFRKVCSAVHFAHQRLVVHRDLKPSNILVTEDGEPKLLDFGIAKLMAQDDDPFAYTQLGLRPMTPEYASPEQIRGEAITTASDVYSLGVLLYLLLTGRRPFSSDGKDRDSLARAILETQPQRPSSVVARAETPPRVPSAEAPLLRKRLAGDLDNIVLMAMKKEPDRRYASVDQLSNDIERHLQDLPVIARQDTLGYRLGKFVARNTLGVSVAALVLLVILGFSVSVTLLWKQAERERERSEEVSLFLQELFENPDPKRSRGDEITAKQILEKGVKEIDKRLANQPDLKAFYLDTMGKVYRRLGLYEDALPLLQTSLQLRQSLDADDPEIANSLHTLGTTLRDADRDAEAEPYIRKAIQFQKEHGDTQGLDYAKGLNNLAGIVEKENPDEALKLYQEALALKKKLPNPDENDIAVTYTNIGNLYAAKRDFPQAKSYLGKSLAIRRRMTKGLPDPDTARSLGNLASLLEDVGDLKKARELHTEALAMRRKLYPEGHRDIARSLNNLAHVLVALGKLQEAEQSYREAVSIATEKSGKDSSERANFIKNLATVLLSEGKNAEAEAQAREAVEVLRRAENPSPGRIADAESVLGACLAAQGKLNEAEPLLKRGYEVLAKETGSDARFAPDARKRLEEYYRAAGKPEEIQRLELSAAAPSSPGGRPTMRP